MTDTAQVADKALDMVSKFGEQLKELGTQMAPQAYELAKGVAQVSALEQLLYGLVCLSIGIGGAIFWKTTYKKWTQWGDDSDCASFLFVFLMCLATVGCLIVAVVQLADAWAWVGLFRPELYIAHTVIHL